MQYKVMEGARVLGVGATAEEAIAAEDKCCRRSEIEFDD